MIQPARAKSRFHPVIIGFAALLCILGPVAVQKAVGRDNGQARPQAENVAPPALPSDSPLPIAATGYAPGGVGQGDYVQPPPELAYELNKATPISLQPNPPARPFAPQWRDEFERLRAVDCLTAAIYYEAAGEGVEGQRAVAQVVLNRVRHPAFAKSVCAVVFEGGERRTGCQFTFVCDGSLSRRPIPALWEGAHKIATAALNGSVYKPVGYATHYHTVWVVPYWGSSLAKLATIGQHIFYRWDGDWGGPAAFKASYVPTETQTDVSELAAVAPIVQKANFVIADAKSTGAHLVVEPEKAPLDLVQVKPLEVASAEPLILPAAVSPEPQVPVIAAPSTPLSRPRTFTRLAAPPGW